VLSRKRAERYELEAPVKYRAGHEQWCEGTTLNVSPSGVLISGALPVACAEPVVVMIELPASDGCLTACGRITRVVETDSSKAHSTFAIAVTRFSLERRSAALARL